MSPSDQALLSQSAPAWYQATAVPEARPSRRRYPRLAFRGVVTLQVGVWSRRRTDAAVDISQTGLRVLQHGGPAMREGASVRLRCAPPATLRWPGSQGLCRLTGTIIRVQPGHGETVAYAVRFDRLIDEQDRWQQGAAVRRTASVAAACLFVFIAWLKLYTIRWFWYDTSLKVYSLIVTGFVLWRVLLSLIYRTPKDQGIMPTVSIVIAAKNEQRHIAQTVEYCLASRYPSDRTEVLVIDDGSTDRTWDVLRAVQARHPSVRLFRFEHNLGKRHAMALGTQEATGEIVVFVDSDGWLEPEGLYRLVQPFADSSVGAVAGHALVALDTPHVIAKMESSRYYISQRIMKAAESVFGAVSCCPGVFSAYRRSALREVLTPWLNQTFLGQPATFGDDRSLTNFILRRYRVLFHHGARCRTYVPERWPTFFRQQLRWKKSWSRETLIACGMMYRKHPVAAIGFYLGAMLTLLAPLVVLRALIYGPLVLHVSCLPYMAGLGLMYGLLCLLYCAHSQSATWLFGLLFAAYYMLVGCWQNYYAILTVNKTHWGTR